MTKITQKITRELVDLLAPEHGRTSCNDSNLSNGYYQLEDVKIRDVVVDRKMTIYPRCNRCFLLENESQEPDPRIEIRVQVSVEPVQPEFEIVQK